MNTAINLLIGGSHEGQATLPNKRKKKKGEMGMLLNRFMQFGYFAIALGFGDYECSVGLTA